MRKITKFIYTINIGFCDKAFFDGLPDGEKRFSQNNEFMKNESLLLTGLYAHIWTQKWVTIVFQ